MAIANTGTIDKLDKGPLSKFRIPAEARIFMVLLGVALIFEILGWFLVGQSFLANKERLLVMILQVSVIGIIAVGVTQIIIMGGIDLSSGSVVALTAMVSASLAQTSEFGRAVFPSLTDLPMVVPLLSGLVVGLACGLLNGFVIAKTAIPPFIATLGLMVTARGLAKWYTEGEPISMLSDSYAEIGSGVTPVLIFLGVAALFHVILSYTRYGKYTYAIGANRAAARVSGINVARHLVVVYAVAGLLSGLAGVVTSSRAVSGQAGMGMMYELDAIAATVIGGTSLMGGEGTLGGTLVGALIMGVLRNGLNLLGVSSFLQQIVIGAVIVVAVLIDTVLKRRRA